MLNTQKYTCAQTITYKLNIVFEYKVPKLKKIEYILPLCYVESDRSRIFGLFRQ